LPLCWRATATLKQDKGRAETFFPFFLPPCLA